MENLKTDLDNLNKKKEDVEAVLNIKKGKKKGAEVKRLNTVQDDLNEKLEVKNKELRNQKNDLDDLEKKYKDEISAHIATLGEKNTYKDNNEKLKSEIASLNQVKT